MTKYKSTFEALTQLSESARSALIPFTEDLENLSRTIEAFNTSGLLQAALSLDEQKLTEAGRFAELISNVNYPMELIDSLNSLVPKLATNHLQETMNKFQSIVNNMGVGNIQKLIREQELASNFDRAIMLEEFESFNNSIIQSLNLSIHENIKTHFENLAGFEIEDDFIDTTIKQLDLEERINDIERTKVQLPNEDIIHEEEQIEYSGKTYDIDEINRTIQKELTDIYFTKPNTVIINNLHIHICKEDNDPIVKRILIKAFENIIVKIVVAALFFLFYLFSSLAIPSLQDRVDSIIQDDNTNDKSVIERKLKKDIQNNPIEPELIQRYRHVTVDILNVRAKPRKASLKVGELRYMQVVRIIDRKKRWVLIEYRQDSDEVLLKGWANLIYLKRFSNK